MQIPVPTLLLVLAMLTTPSIAQRRRLGDQQAAFMVGGAVSQTDIPNIGEEAMVESIIPSNATRPPTLPTPQAMPAKPMLPITALLYSSSPGPKECRGTPIFKLNIPKGAGIATPQGPTCYNVISAPQAECGTFTANMEDGCQARVFGEQDCTEFTNIAVFMEELRPVGGIIRSIEVQCGIKSSQPAPLALNLPSVQKPAGSPSGG
ncbi:hypothetical protein SUNI508_02078 [Seiridium unicorne]|uniref:Uncharacterized protein n=1 Tax=Seiridium unicorne TaxID=138068 RepID=A0ABR2ULC5_9PEZI